MVALYPLGAAFGLLAAFAALLHAQVLWGDMANRADAVTIVPASAWNIDYAEQKCRLQRLFGTDDEPYLLAIEQSVPGTSFSMTLAGQAVAPLARGGPVFVGLQDDQPINTPSSYLIGQLEGFGTALIFANLGLPSDAAEGKPAPRAQAAGINLSDSRKVERITLSNQDRVVVMETANMQNAFRALNACTLDLLEQLGLNPEQHRFFSSPRWLNEQDIARAIHREYARITSTQSAVFQMRVIVEPDGTVSDCALLEATKASALKPRAYNAMRKAQFEPALDAAGEPMRSFYSASISYVSD